MIRKIIIIGVMAALTAFMSCSKAELGSFQQNESDPDYQLFNILDEYPAIKEGFTSLDQYTFNELMANAVNANVEAYLTFGDELIRIINNENKPVNALLTDLRVVLDRMINQDKHDRETTSTNYTGNFFDFLDMLSEKNLGLSKDIIAILSKSMQYQKDQIERDPYLIGKSMHNLYADLTDARTPNYAANKMADLFGVMSRILIQADYPMYETAAGDLITNRSDIAAGTPTGLGNSHDGIVSLIKGLNQVFHRDPTAKQYLFNTIRELGPALNATNGANGTTAYNVMKTLMCNTEDYFTPEGYIFKNNPLLYNTNNTNTYSYAELKNTIKDILPGIRSILLRDDRKSNDKSIAFIPESQKQRYLLDSITENLAKLNIDWDKAKLEESIYDVLRYDTLGRDRLSTSENAWPCSMLESFLFIANVGLNIGWEDGKETQEYTVKHPNDILGNDQYYANYYHGHGNNTRALSTNDCLYSLRLKNTIDLGTPLGLYEIGFNNGDTTLHPNSKIFRSKDEFSKTYYTDNNVNAFRYNQDGSGISFMTGASVGDCGLPAGESPDLNKYIPYAADGIGDTNLTSWNISWMVRACWNGEGPYYSKDKVTMENGKYVYYRPNGKIYATVDKSNSDSTKWEYTYPAVDTEPVDKSVTGNQRENRFKPSWYTDYYMIRIDGTSLLGYGFTYFVTPDEEVANDTNRFKKSTEVKAGRLLIHEVPIDNADRECATQEEAIYRNYQWVVTEKKFVLIIPLYIEVLGNYAAVYQIVEGNGFSGFTAARNFREMKGTGVWAKKGEATAYSTNSTDSWETSDIPGDYRITFRGKNNAGLLAMDLIVSSLTNGSMVPAIITHNLPSIYRFGFPRQKPVLDESGSYMVDQLGSKPVSGSSLYFTYNDANWKKRNTLLPVIVAALGALRENTTTEFRPIVRVLESLIPLSMPQFYYNNNAAGAAVADSWVCRINGSDTNPYDFLMPDCGVSGFITSTDDPTAWYGGDVTRNYYQPRALNTLTSLLVDSSLNNLGKAVADRRDSSVPRSSLADGLLPLMTYYNSSAEKSDTNQSPSRLVTNLIKFLARLGTPLYSDRSSYSNSTKDDQSTWGMRRKVEYGLEQLLTTIKAEKGQATKINAARVEASDIIYPNWFFTDGGTRPEDANINTTLDNIVGNGTKAMGGIAVFREEYEGSAATKSWGDYEEDINSMKAMLAKDGAYSVVENLINVMDKAIAGVSESDITDARIEALIHTLGMLLSKYENGSWKTETITDTQFNNILDILTSHLPVILGSIIYEDGYAGDKNYIKYEVLNKFISLNAAFMEPDGFVEYILSNAHSSGTFAEIIAQLYEFINQSPYGGNGVNILAPDSPFWADLIELLKQLNEATRNTQTKGLDQIYESSGFQYNGEDSSLTGNGFNLYKGLGTILSR